MSDATDRLEADLAADRARLNETLRALESRIAPSSLAKEAMHYLDIGAGDFASRLGRQLYDNPLPSLLTGIGLAWLIGSGMSGRTIEGPTPEELRDRDLFNILEEEDARTLRRDDEEMSAFENRKLSSMALVVGVTREEGEEHESFRRRVLNAAAKVKEGARIAGEKIAAAASAAKHAASDAAHLAQRGASAAAHGASAAAHGVGAATKAAGAGASSLYHGAKDAPGRIANFNEDHPLASGAIGFALGAVIGSVTPLTRVEHDALKKLADAGLARGADFAEHAASIVSGAAQGAGERPALAE